jgi:hypothetical protein
MLLLQPFTMGAISSAVAGALPLVGVPMVRRMPRNTARTPSVAVGNESLELHESGCIRRLGTILDRARHAPAIRGDRRQDETIARASWAAVGVLAWLAIRLIPLL